MTPDLLKEYIDVCFWPVWWIMFYASIFEPFGSNKIKNIIIKNINKNKETEE